MTSINRYRYWLTLGQEQIPAGTARNSLGKWVPKYDHFLRSITLYYRYLLFSTIRQENQMHLLEAVKHKFLLTHIKEGCMPFCSSYTVIQSWGKKKIKYIIFNMNLEVLVTMFTIHLLPIYRAGTIRLCRNTSRGGKSLSTELVGKYLFLIATKTNRKK